MGKRFGLCAVCAGLVVCLSCSFALAETFRGTVIAIDGNAITVRDHKGQETTAIVDVKDIKTGDMVELKDGKVIKAGGKKKSAVEAK
ncbi:MAG: hypothetical protein EPN22_03700 [Nitrospirae bacterium]|nr:MAG: hypothetical protein EPN22_03700 [Nitrospirota bacterium]